MRNLLLNNIRRLLISKKIILYFILVSIVVLIGTCFCSAGGQEGGEAGIVVGVANHDVNPYSVMLVEYFKSSPTLSSFASILEGESDQLEKMFYKKELDAYLEIPEGFVENLSIMENMPVQVRINGSSVLKAVLLQNIFECYEKYVSAVEVNAAAFVDQLKSAGAGDALVNKKNTELSYSLVLTALGKDQFFHTSELRQYPGTPLSNYYVLNFICTILLYGGMFGGMQLLEERASKILNRLKASGIPMIQILSARLLINSLFLSLLWLVPYLLVSLMQKNIPSPAHIFLAFTAALWSGGFSLLISSLVHKKQAYLMVSNIICLFMVVAGGGIIPIMYLPNPMVELSKYTLNYWFVKGMLEASRSHVEMGMQIGGVLLVITIFMLLLAGLFYHRDKA